MKQGLLLTLILLPILYQRFGESDAERTAGEIPMTGREG